ncbi:MAG: hypothetical protein IT342_01230 [Candidatus Melainabacteria bacterium]|nr:hypothetical protein [Candidatus Melainabacteria bacterium]
MLLQLPTRMQALVDAGKRVMQLMTDAGFFIARDRGDDDASRANDIEDGRRTLDQVEGEMAKLNFGLQLLRTLQLGREKKWKEAYAEIEAAVAFSRGKPELMESWSVVRYQLDYMRVEAEPVTEQS